MTSDAYPIHGHVNPLQRLARAVRGLMRRVNAFDMEYVDPWERRRR